jgi:hypothetical protein
VGGTAGDGSATTFHYGRGGERLIYRGLGLGADLGNVTPIGDFGHWLGIFSATASYSFGGRQSSRRITPFVSGGYSLKFRDDDDSGGQSTLAAASSIGPLLVLPYEWSFEIITFSKEY